LIEAHEAQTLTCRQLFDLLTFAAASPVNPPKPFEARQKAYGHLHVPKGETLDLCQPFEVIIDNGGMVDPYAT